MKIYRDYRIHSLIQDQGSKKYQLFRNNVHEDEGFNKEKDI